MKKGVMKQYLLVIFGILFVLLLLFAFWYFLKRGGIVG
jgi:Mg2+ and Co2+ transporter CorA